MDLYTLEGNKPKKMTPTDEGARADLWSTPIGRHTAGELFDQGHPVCFKGRWVLPSRIFTKNGFRSLQKLSVMVGYDAYVWWLELREGEELVKRDVTVRHLKPLVLKK